MTDKCNRLENKVTNNEAHLIMIKEIQDNE